jgi:hypothetical protein
MSLYVTVFPTFHSTPSFALYSQESATAVTALSPTSLTPPLILSSYLQVGLQMLFLYTCQEEYIFRFAFFSLYVLTE